MNMMNFTRVALKKPVFKACHPALPGQPRDYPARTRGQVAIDMDACILCGMCMRKCPAGAIQVDRAARTWSIERFGCIQCNSCVENCPKKCLHMERSYPQPDAHKRVDTVEKPPELPKEPPATAAKSE